MDELDTPLAMLDRLFAIIAVALAAVAYPILASAHAFPVSEEPKVGSTISSPPTAVAIAFDSPIENLFAQLSVSSEGGDDEALSAPALSADHRELSVAVKPLKPGDYIVKWSVVAKDGHRTEGSFQFTVAAGAR